MVYNLFELLVAKIYGSEVTKRLLFRRGGVESTITRVTAADGLELTPTLITTRAEEKAALGSLNDRFVSYIEKVRGLVSRNQILEMKVKQVRDAKHNYQSNHSF